MGTKPLKFYVVCPQHGAAAQQWLRLFAPFLEDARFKAGSIFIILVSLEGESTSNQARGSEINPLPACAGATSSVNVSHYPPPTVTRRSNLPPEHMKPNRSPSPVQVCTHAEHHRSMVERLSALTRGTSRVHPRVSYICGCGFLGNITDICLLNSFCCRSSGHTAQQHVVSVLCVVFPLPSTAAHAVSIVDSVFSCRDAPTAVGA